MSNFSVGSKVKWKSQAAGSAVVKVGRVIEVVPDGARPTKLGYTRLSRRYGCDSYVVEAQPVIPGYGARPVRLGKVQVYWPLTGHLRAWNGGTKPADLRVR